MGLLVYDFLVQFYNYNINVVRTDNYLAKDNTIMGTYDVSVDNPVTHSIRILIIHGAVPYINIVRIHTRNSECCINKCLRMLCWIARD